ncbi:hypothetical protein A2875_03500 [Candidatus Gottesmanbacteria bacterium RIFCSPHIGHO2_01_FULL_46_14]|uniref:Glycosyl transferase family 1 domain-containing protein n=2 Tax=Candidatus Gottesmaniibacteriota TaxID=1752720 RepID=A0A1F5ZPS2_9BACT|nr:MAG: hypothetical protein A2875_03500 [Candidatus Gottesmanbacteria bacterium RIFCSPHIGHO2_01_FULL_46_14]OGG28820.1 MAG: hypothetical protein A2971_02695 [Candidatus Gottesmanbacteria bacterium RIFCSPLOWO2_01_FULL_46_21]
MRIGIDGRLINETGVGRYIRNLIAELAQTDKKNNYIVFVGEEWKPPNERWEIRKVDIPWHSVAEQVELPVIFAREHLDLLHIPYFTIPIFYPGKFIVTMHDLTILHFPTGKATKLPLPLYWAKVLAYRAILEIGLHRAAHIISVSHATREELMDHFALDERKISVIYEGVRQSKSNARLIKEPYFLYVGNAYPHKNLETLLRAIGTNHLVLVGKEDLFYKRLARSNNVIFFGQASDEQLASLYTHATALVFPSLMEGFGLPALEAAVHGAPIICSDIPAFREILGSLGNYFNPHDVSALRWLLIHPEKLKKPTKQDQQELLKRFSWRQMAGETLRLYERV